MSRSVPLSWRRRAYTPVTKQQPYSFQRPRTNGKNILRPYTIATVVICPIFKSEQKAPGWKILQRWIGVGDGKPLGHCTDRTATYARRIWK